MKSLTIWNDKKLCDLMIINFSVRIIVMNELEAVIGFNHLVNYKSI